MPSRCFWPLSALSRMSGGVMTMSSGSRCWMLNGTFGSQGSISTGMSFFLPRAYSASAATYSDAIELRDQSTTTRLARSMPSWIEKT